MADLILSLGTRKANCSSLPSIFKDILFTLSGIKSEFRLSTKIPLYAFIETLFSLISNKPIFANFCYLRTSSIRNLRCSSNIITSINVFAVAILMLVAAIQTTQLFTMSIRIKVLAIGVQLERDYFLSIIT